MACSDEDLKSLKSWLRLDINQPFNTPCTLYRWQVEDILARLKAAEALIQDIPQYEPEIEKLRQAWRKAAGR